MIFVVAAHARAALLLAGLLGMILGNDLSVSATQIPATLQHVEVQGRSMAYEVYRASMPGGVVILLHGTGGMANPFYRSQARWFAQHGLTVLLPHYTDVAHWSGNGDAAYATWVTAVQVLIGVARSSEFGAVHVAMVGYSQGASIALAAGSQNAAVDAIAEWYGSLPDAWFLNLRGMPPLLVLHGQQDQVIPVRNAEQILRLCSLRHLVCESHIYAGLGHGLSKDAALDADQRTLDFIRRHFAQSPGGDF